MPKLPTLSARHAARLDAIARVLDVPVEMFFQNHPVDDEEEVLALLRLWSAIDNRPARRRLLNFVRQEAQRSGYDD